MDPFAGVESDYGPCPASPRFDEGEEGLKVAAPERADLDSGAPFPVCASLRLQPAQAAALGGVNWDHVWILLTREDGGFAAAGSLHPTPPPPPSPPRDDSDRPRHAEDDAIPLFESEIAGGWRNVHLAEHLRMPAGPGTYYLFLNWGPMQSNTVRIEFTKGAPR